MNLNRENLLAIVCIILTIGFFLSILGSNQEIKEYKKAYTECKDAYTMAENGRLPLWTYQNLSNITVNNNVLQGELK